MGWFFSFFFFFKGTEEERKRELRVPSTEMVEFSFSPLSSFLHSFQLSRHKYMRNSFARGSKSWTLNWTKLTPLYLNSPLLLLTPTDCNSLATLLTCRALCFAIYRKKMNLLAEFEFKFSGKGPRVLMGRRVKGERVKIEELG